MRALEELRGERSTVWMMALAELRGERSSRFAGREREEELWRWWWWTAGGDREEGPRGGWVGRMGTSKGPSGEGLNVGKSIVGGGVGCGGAVVDDGGQLELRARERGRSYGGFPLRRQVL